MRRVVDRSPWDSIAPITALTNSFWRSGLAENWGKLPEKERARALLELTRDMPARHRELIENYFKNLAKAENTSK